MSRDEEKLAMNEKKDIQPVGLDKVNTSTRLLGKNYSPLIVRKYQMYGWPLFVSLICDVSLSDLDNVVHNFTEDYGPIADDIQAARNYVGELSDCVLNYYNQKKRGSVEGVAILYYIDKCFISSLYGDFMVHASCKQELYAIINTLPHI